MKKTGQFLPVAPLAPCMSGAQVTDIHFIAQQF